MTTVTITHQIWCDDAYGSDRVQVEQLGSLTTPPAMSPAEGFEEDDGIQPIFFDGLDWKGKPTKVFAWVGLPKGASTSNRVPGVVLVHGGGGTAFKDWVAKWNDHGFAAISIALEGQTDLSAPDDKKTKVEKWQRHAHGGPARNGIYGDSKMPLKDQWMYHSVANTILANSLLHSLPEVDPAKVGIMGVSWGGVITSTVIGIDGRFAFAIPTYGCGDLDKAPNQYGRALRNNHIYKQVWEPMLRLAGARMPTLWLSWPGDAHFPMDCLQASREKISGPSEAALVPGLGHGHAPAWNREESYAFAKSVVEGGKPWCASKATEIQDGKIRAVFASGRTLESAALISTTGRGNTGSRTWIETPAELELKDGHWIATAELPQGTTGCFLNVKSGSLVSTSAYLKP